MDLRFKRPRLRIDYSNDPEYSAELAQFMRRLGDPTLARNPAQNVRGDIKAVATCLALSFGGVALLVATFFLNSR